MQERHVPLRHRMERKTLHDGGMPELLFRSRTVQGVERRAVGVPVLRRLGRQGLQRAFRTELQRRARQ